MFKGSLVALVTPMQKDGTIDKKSLLDLIEWHIAAKTDGIVVSGTTGESATLSLAEHADLVETVVKKVNKRIPVIAGSGSDSTQHAVKLTLQAKNAGADAALIVTPYYNKPTQKGLQAHYQFIAENTDFPIILYNVPSRTSCDLLPETVAKIAKIPQVIGIKEATGKMERVTEILDLCGERLAIYSGDDMTALNAMFNGAKGVISVTANIVPLLMKKMCDAVFNSAKEDAEKINDLLTPLHKNLFLESNPIPVKWALADMGLIPEGIRLPLLPLDTQFHTILRNTIKSTREAVL